MTEHAKYEIGQNTAIPYPLEPGRGLSPFLTWNLPAMMLSWASCLAFLAVMAPLLFNERMRTWFRIEWGGLDSRFLTLLIAWAAALLAIHIARRCWHRPGHWFPRLWSQLSALGSLGLAVYQMFFHQRDELAPYQDTATLACLAAALVLAFRLKRFHPDSPHMRWAAPLVLLLVVPVFAGFDYWVYVQAERLQREVFEEKLATLQNNARALAGCADAGKPCSEKLYLDSSALLERMIAQKQWQQSADVLGQTQVFSEARAEMLDGLVLESSRRLERKIAGEAENWRQNGLAGIRFDEFSKMLERAAEQGRAERGSMAGRAYADVVDALLDVLEKHQAKLDEAPVVYGKSDGPWPSNPGFQHEAQQLVEHYQSLRRLYDGIGELANKSSQFIALQGIYAEHSKWDEGLERLGGDWASHWLRPYLEQGQDSPAPTFEQAFKMPVIAGIVANDVDNLSRLDWQDIESKKGASNCDWMKSEKDEEVESLQCRTYRASKDGKAELMVELRLVYKRESHERLRLVYLIPLPHDMETGSFITEIGDAFSVAKKPLRVFQTMTTDEANKKCPPYGKWVDECANILDFTNGQKYLRLLIYHNKWKRYDD